jgi:hypothetical protein
LSAGDLTRRTAAWDRRGVTDFIANLFDSYYDVLAIALVVLVPVWFSRFLFESAATLLARRRRHD